MAEQDKQKPAGVPQGPPVGGNPQAPAGAPAPQSGQAKEPEANPKISELMTRATKAEMEAAALRAQLQALQPYVKLGPAGTGEPYQPGWQAGQPAPSIMDVPEEPTAGTDQIKDMIRQIEARTTEVAAQTMAEVFLAKNPDLEPYQNLVAAIMRDQTDPRAPLKTRLEHAASICRQMIEAEREKGRKSALEQAQARTQQEQATAGVTEGTGGQATSQEDLGWTKAQDGSYPDYAAFRRQLAKQQFEIK